MTPLQILRNALNDGLNLQLSEQPDGYHITVTGLDDRRIEIVDRRLDQAIHRVRHWWEETDAAGRRDGDVKPEAD